MIENTFQKHSALRCLDCNLINVFPAYKADGNVCMKCGGQLTHIGESRVYLKKSKNFCIEINADTSQIDEAIQKVIILNNELEKTKEYMEYVEKKEADKL